MIIETRIYDDKTIIPNKYLKKYNLEEDDIVIWNEKENGEILISFKKKQPQISHENKLSKMNNASNNNQKKIL